MKIALISVLMIMMFLYGTGQPSSVWSWTSVSNKSLVTIEPVGTFGRASGYGMDVAGMWRLHHSPLSFGLGSGAHSIQLKTGTYTYNPEAYIPFYIAIQYVQADERFSPLISIREGYGLYNPGGNSPYPYAGFNAAGGSYPSSGPSGGFYGSGKLGVDCRISPSFHLAPYMGLALMQFYHLYAEAGGITVVSIQAGIAFQLY